MSELTIVFVEDDLTQAETFQQALKSYCENKRKEMPNLRLFTSEASFLTFLQNTTSPADLYIFDLMLRWREVGENLTIQKPSNYHADLAGVRCKDAVRHRFPNARIIIWTMIKTDHIPDNVFAGCKLVRDKLEINVALGLIDHQGPM